jgi:hypothetical protein
LPSSQVIVVLVHLVAERGVLECLPGDNDAGLIA